MLLLAEVLHTTLPAQPQHACSMSTVPAKLTHGRRGSMSSFVFRTQRPGMRTAVASEYQTRAMQDKENSIEFNLVQTQRLKRMSVYSDSNPRPLVTPERTGMTSVSIDSLIGCMFNYCCSQADQAQQGRARGT